MSCFEVGQRAARSRVPSGRLLGEDREGTKPEPFELRIVDGIGRREHGVAGARQGFRRIAAEVARGAPVIRMVLDVVLDIV
jgi:hypothetical protein